MRIQPDGVLGAVMASEGLCATETLVNGAGGCRSRTQIVLRDSIPSYSPEDTGCCGSRYFSRQSRLPCTYLNGDDMVFGCDGKVEAAMGSIREVSGKGAVLVDTLAASLACTEHAPASDGGPIILDGDLSSMTFDEGYDATVRAILENIPMETVGSDSPSVNILGYGIADMGWDTGAECISDLLERIGIETRFIGCRNGTLDGIPSADLNVMLHPQRSVMTAEMLGRRFSTPYVRPSQGAPIGYRATSSFVTEIADRLGIDPEPALAAIREDERKVRMRLMNLNKGVNGLRSRSLCIDCGSSIAYPLTVWMVEKFGLVPASIVLTDNEYRPELESYLEGLGFGDAMDSPMPGEPDVVFTDGVTAGIGRRMPSPTSYVEIRPPTLRGIDLLDRCIVGTRGCRYILEEMLSNVGRFRCGQPSNADMR